jgi:hypothetical protein
MLNFVRIPMNFSSISIYNHLLTNNSPLINRRVVVFSARTHVRVHGVCSPASLRFF